MEKPSRANYIGENTGGWAYLASAGWGALGGEGLRHVAAERENWDSHSGKVCSFLTN